MKLAEVRTSGALLVRWQAYRASGFTLVELVVTLVIIAALAAVSAPLFFTTQTFEESGVFNETLSAVRYAQKLAVATCSPVRIHITAGGYDLFRAGAEPVTCNNPCTVAGTAAAVQDPSDASRNFSRVIPASTAFISAPNPVPTDVIFCPLGNATADATITVGGRSFRVWANTGFVERL